MTPLTMVIVLVLFLCCRIPLGNTFKKPSTPSPHHERVVLVTGAAGFIGFHISQQLIQEWGVRQVVGLDTFNHYYDVQLKKDRASQLLRMHAKVYRGDVCDAHFLRFLMLKYNFTDVVHMAAQAGVRYSLEDPQAYVSANYECFISLLDVLLEFPAYLVYASSSSVYGKRASVPFSSEEPLRAPGNIYAASKIMNEHLAAAYCSQHSLLSVGLRFFTVYGPWGRPDMAAYKFAESIVTGKPVPLFEANSGQQLKRDFTYIDDIVSGVLAALDHMPGRCGEAYNLGYGQPLVVEDMLKYLQQELNTRAFIDRLPLPPSDMVLTFADITTSKKVLGFSPKISTAEGIHHFVAWFKDYYNGRVQWEKSGRDPARNAMLEQALEEGDKEIAAYQMKILAYENDHYQERLSTLRQSYIKHAEKESIPLPNWEKRKFILHKGKQSPGSAIIRATGYGGNTQLLETRCLATDQCIAFTSGGEFKNHLLPPQQWQESAEDLYVADVDMCAADLHRCGPHANCQSSGAGTYECDCMEDYKQVGRSCVEQYRKGQTTSAEQQWKICDHIDNVNWTALIAGRQFVFFQGLDSPGGDYLIGGEDAAEACRTTQHCIAYNTNGILKHSLQPPQHWVHWTDDPHRGLYVLDIDYCQLSLEQCPSHSHCVRNGPANYSCQCIAPYLPSKSGSCEMAHKEPEISVVLSVDQHHLVGLGALLNSLRKHTSRGDQLTVYIVVLDMASDALLSYLTCHHLDTLQVKIIELSSAAVSPLHRVIDSPDVVGNLASAANFARFQIPTLLPQLHHGIYLDVDTIVLGDIAELWDYLLSSNKMMVAVPRSSVTYGGIFSKTVKELFQTRYGKSFRDSDPTFNAGLWGMNFDLWREQHMHNEVQYWTQQHSQQALWRFGTQPILLLLAHDQWDHLPLEWNVDGLGWNGDIPQHMLDTAKLLHWNGKNKPWLSSGLYQHLWTQYQPLECSGQGQCEEDSSEKWVCKCEQGFSGQLCNIVQLPQ